jgi:DNA-binding protein HU-beta
MRYFKPFNPGKANMNKSELITKVSEDTAFSKKDIARVLSAVTSIIEKELKAGNKVSITGFGAYWVSKRPSRSGINPATKERITLPEVRIPRFKPGKQLKENIRSV